MLTPRRIAVGLALVCTAVLGLCVAQSSPGERRLKLLFLGDNGHHQPRARFQQIQPVMKSRGIDVTYTDQASDLNPAPLNGYDGLILYANIDSIKPEQEKALLDYVSARKGVVPLTRP